jgi:hypothetical protein
VARLDHEPDPHRRTEALLPYKQMTTASSEPLFQRLAAIREQLKLLADYL